MLNEIYSYNVMFKISFIKDKLEWKKLNFIWRETNTHLVSYMNIKIKKCENIDEYHEMT